MNRQHRHKKRHRTTKEGDDTRAVFAPIRLHPAEHKTSDTQNGRKESYPNENTSMKSAPMWIQAACAIAVVIITSVYTYYARQQVKETQRAIIQTEELANRAERPFVLVKDVSETPNVPLTPSRVAFSRIVPVNYGKSPAVKERLNGKVFVGPDAVSNMERYFTALPERLTGPVGVFPPGGQDTIDRLPAKAGRFRARLKVANRAACDG